MQIRMTNLEQISLREMEELLSGSAKVSWEAKDVGAKYAILADVLKVQGYRKLSKRERGIVRRFLAKVKGDQPRATDPVDRAVEQAA